MGKRTWAPGSPDYLYHVYDDPKIKAPFTSASLKVAPLSSGGVDHKDMFSLKQDMDKLRADGVKKGIVEATSSLGKASLPAPDDRDLMVLKVGNPAAKDKVLVVGCHHAREWISVEIPYLIAEYLIYSYKDPPTTDKEKRIKHLLMNRQIWFVPLVNPDGHVNSVTIDRDWRSNMKGWPLASTEVPNPPLMAPQFVVVGKPAVPDKPIRFAAKTYVGVDVNRNYPTTTWGQETYHKDGSKATSRNPEDCGASGKSIWCGPSAGSEAETKIIAGIVSKFRAAITYHSFEEVIYYPDAAKGETFVEDLGKGLVTLIGEAPGHSYEFRINSDPKSYPTTGELVDYCYQLVPKRPAFTPELRPKDTPGAPGFSALPEAEIEPCFLENLKAALALINCAGFDILPATSTTVCVPGLKSGDPPVCTVVENCWKVFKGWTP